MGMFGIEGIAALIAKIGSASTVAHAAAGLGIALVGVTGAGAAGVLPGPLQDRVAGAVEAVTPFDLPTSDDVHASTHDSAPDDGGHSADDPGVVPATVAPPPAAPSSAHADEHEHETEVEHATETAEGTHQHRGGSATTASSGTVTHDAGDDSGTHAPEVEDDDSTDDSGHHSGGD